MFTHYRCNVLKTSSGSCAPSCVVCRKPLIFLFVQDGVSVAVALVTIWLCVCSMFSSTYISCATRTYVISSSLRTQSCKRAMNGWPNTTWSVKIKRGIMQTDFTMPKYVNLQYPRSAVRVPPPDSTGSCPSCIWYMTFGAQSISRPPIRRRLNSKTKRKQHH